MVQKLSSDQEAAIQVVIGYCAPELNEMFSWHDPQCLVHKAAVEFLALAGLSYPQFLVENADRFGASHS